MKYFLTLFVAVSLVFSAQAQNWAVDKSHSNVGFTVTHMLLSEVDGQFTNIDANFVSGKEDFSDAVFSFTADVNSVDTRIERRDNHLKSGDFFDVEKFPKMSFKSTSFKHVSGKNYALVGDLTIKDVTKPVTLDVVINGPVVNPRSQKQMVGIKASGTIDRFDFGVGGESGTAVSREIAIHANGEFTRE
ncbi:YceI family protein [Marinilongibacter aquaticus]|uniref:YceI family protein n=1 Tax=Marinilongibacter aquaticus TaxID=2975157 RepID=UPI0021BD76ED|nr:YceI family protein [Marinilongibacter aquaticus]UBM60851.1 YceI family protein [Marinilongibacter aquaticus]